jgi:glycosyltransferase involved in cell wall biosynthesis
LDGRGGGLTDMSEASPLVSIVIPTYNHAHYLGEAIESAVGQDGVPVEVIVVDDGSQDDPAAIVGRYPGVRLIRQKNAGLAAARNTGWRAANGSYLVFLDADDRLMPGALSTNLESFRTRPDCAFVYGAYRFIRADGSVRNEANFTEIGPDPFETFLRGNAIGMHATVMYRREALEESGGFDPALRACEDYDLYLRLSRRHPVASRRRCLAEYRMHDANMSRKTSFMLHWALLALRRQRGESERSDKLRAAYRAGLRNWKRIYLRRQLAAVRRERTGAAVGDFLKVALAAPAELVGLAVGLTTRRFYRRRS